MSKSSFSSQISKLQLENNVAYHGDVLFTEKDKKQEVIEGQTYITFTPNTITYAINSKNADLFNKVARSKFGIAIHTRYNIERTDGKVYGTNPSSIYAKVGLMYPSDYGYATVGGTTTNRAGCRAKAVFDYDTADCKNNDWLFTSQATSWGSNVDEWLLSPYSSFSTNAARLGMSGFVGLGTNYNYVGNYQYAVRPTFYLDSSVLKIVGTGDGTKDNAYRVG